MQVLLIEDDDTIAEPLREGLERYGLQVERVATGAEALRGPYGDIVLLDLGLPAHAQSYGAHPRHRWNHPRPDGRWCAGLGR